MSPRQQEAINEEESSAAGASNADDDGHSSSSPLPRSPPRPTSSTEETETTCRRVSFSPGIINERGCFRNLIRKQSSSGAIETETETNSSRSNSSSSLSKKTKTMATRKSAIGLRHALSISEHQGSNRLKKAVSLMHVSVNRFEDEDDCKHHNAKLTVEELEKGAREKAAVTGRFTTILLDFVAAFKVFALYLITPATVMASLFAAGLTVYWYNDILNSNDTKDGSIDRILLTFAVIVPMSASLRMAFIRREQALLEIAKFRSFSFSIYMAHSTWDWVNSGGGRAAISSTVDWLAHSDQLMAHLIAMADELCRFLTLPTSSRGRHRFTRRGRVEAMRTAEVAYRLFDSINTQRLTRINLMTEQLKTYGLSATECSRIHQFERYLAACCENLRLIKSYRTPMALRAFARVFIFFLPPLYASSFAQTAINMESLGLGIVFSVITTVGLGALFASIEVIEDPFVGYAVLDGIDVKEEFQILHWQQLVNAREVVYPDAASTDVSSLSVPALMASLDNIRSSTTKRNDDDDVFRTDLEAPATN